MKDPLAKAREAAKPGSYRARVLSAAGWTVFARVASQGLRLASNLLLTRLLYPEAFGLMAVVYSFLDGLRMFSEVGVGLSVIQDERGEDPAFLDTAWTIQVLRGVGLWLVTVGLAWPLAGLYGEPDLAPLLCIAGFIQVVRGFESMSTFLLSRHLGIGKRTVIELAAQVISTIAMIAMVASTGTIWGLALGPLIGELVKTVVSHRIAESPRHRFRLEREAGSSLYRFGRWILLATPLAWMINQGDRVLLGAFVSMEQLGVYAVAALIVKALEQMSLQLGNRVILPVYARVGKETTPTLRRRVARLRLGLMSAFMPPLWLLILWGDWLIELLYDERYHGAGWIIRVLATGAVFAVVGRTGPMHLARGEALTNLVGNAVPAVFLAAALAVGWQVAGFPGLVVALAATNAVRYPVEAWIARRYGMWLPSYDLVGLGLTGLVVASAWWLV